MLNRLAFLVCLTLGLLIVIDKFGVPSALRGGAFSADSLSTSSAAVPAGAFVEDGKLDPAVREAQRRQIEESAALTYLDSLMIGTDSLIRRWPDRAGRPLRVAMIGGGTADYHPRLQAMVRDAAARWEQEGLGFTFRFESDTQDVEITVRWTTNFAPSERAGQTDLVWDRIGHIRSAAITLAVRDPLGQLFTDEALQAVAVHELGHGVGLPHSNNSEDVMFPRTETGRISRRDRATAFLLYQLQPGSLKTDLQR